METFKEYAVSKFEKNYEQFYKSFDEFKEHFESGEVKVPFPDMVKMVEEYHTRKLPSRFQNGDKVSLKFEPWLVVTTGEVIKVHFTESKVLYDVEVVLYPGVEAECYTRIYNIDSTLLSPSEYKSDE